jgi:hypothetical protein
MADVHELIIRHGKEAARGRMATNRVQLDASAPLAPGAAVPRPVFPRKSATDPAGRTSIIDSPSLPGHSRGQSLSDFFPGGTVDFSESLTASCQIFGAGAAR